MITLLEKRGKLCLIMDLCAYFSAPQMPYECMRHHCMPVESAVASVKCRRAVIVVVISEPPGEVLSVWIKLSTLY